MSIDNNRTFDIHVAMYGDQTRSRLSDLLEVGRDLISDGLDIAMYD